MARAHVVLVSLHVLILRQNKDTRKKRRTHRRLVGVTKQYRSYRSSKSGCVRLFRCFLKRGTHADPNVHARTLTSTNTRA